MQSCSGLDPIKALPFAVGINVHDHFATNLTHVRLVRFRLFVAGQRNGFANLPRNVAASTTPKPRADICISRSSLRNSTLSPQHSFNYCFRWIFTLSVLKASYSDGYLLARNSVAVQSQELDYCNYFKHQSHTFTMKYRYVAIAASAATGVSAQAPPAYTPPAVSTPASSLPVAPVSSAPVSYTTVTYDDCPSQSIQTLITVTNGITVTYCPECQHSISSAAPLPSHTTVYTTVYSSLCSTGLVPVTYTVTEECAEATPTWATGTAKDDHVPQGFTVTVKDCHVCNKTPVPVTITEPCKDGCGKPAPPPATGAPSPSGGNVGQIPDGQVQAPGPSGGSGGNNSPAPSGGNGGSGSPAPSGGASNPGSGSPDTGAQRPPASGDDSKCPGPQCASGNKPATPGSSPSEGGNAPYPTGNSTAEGCPGPQCAKPSSGSGGKTDTGVEESTGGAANVVSFGFVSSLCMATVVAALAFAL